MIDWARAQFAMTAIYHWFFVPMTVGLSFIMAIMESMYYRTNNPEYKRMTKFWMNLFGINFVIGIATGLILEFEFGLNWSNFSWMVGDIFGAPLAIEGIVAFFLETTFVAVMFFGWGKVSKKFHLTSTWLVFIGSNMSALWILVANSWMEYPVGMHFNPDTARNEMINFWEILSPVAINKFFHTVTSCYALAAVFVIGVSCWHILKKKNIELARKSILIASIFGFFASLFVAYTGDQSAYLVAKTQPMKLAALEGLHKGQKGAGLIVFGILKPGKENDEDNFSFKIEIPKLLSFMGYKNANAFVPGIDDLLNGNQAENIPSFDYKMEKGKLAHTALTNYKKAIKEGKVDSAKKQLAVFEENIKYYGYGYFENKDNAIPNIPLNFYGFRIMVMIGFYLIAIYLLFWYLAAKNKLENLKIWLNLALITIPIVYLASVSGWILTEVGRQPWAITDILPTFAATSNIGSTQVMLTFIFFVIIFAALLIANIKIMTKQIKNGYKD